MEADDAMQPDRREFLQAAGVAATAALGGLSSAAHAAGEASGTMKFHTSA